MKPETMTAFANALLAAAPLRTNDQAHALAGKVDRLGLIRAQIDQLTNDAAAIRDELEEAGLKTIEGTLYRASFAQCQGKTATDWRTIAERFKPSPQLIRRHTTQGDPYTSLKLTAKTAKH